MIWNFESYDLEELYEVRDVVRRYNVFDEEMREELDREIEEREFKLV